MIAKFHQSLYFVRMVQASYSSMTDIQIYQMAHLIKRFDRNVVDWLPYVSNLTKQHLDAFIADDPFKLDATYADHRNWYKATFSTPPSATASP